MDGCPGCESTNSQILQPELPSFRHLDFGALARPGRYLLCRDCGLLANADSAAGFDVEEMFLTADYAESAQTGQTVQSDDGSLTRSALQARWLAEVLDLHGARILDIGCYDGALLKEISRRVSDAEFHGYDVNPHVAALFPGEAGFTFHRGDLADIVGPFDLVTSSHSLMYLPGLRGVLASVRAALGPGGVLFVQAPDVARNPYSALLGDQRYYFTAQNLCAVLAANGFAAELVGMDDFRREIVVMASPGEAPAEAVDAGRFSAMFAGLAATRDDLLALAEPDIAVLGTTANAAFVDAVLGDRLKVFADENEARIGTMFRAKPVVHPRELGAETLLVLPFGDSAAAIEARLATRTSARLLAV